MKNPGKAWFVVEAFYEFCVDIFSVFQNNYRLDMRIEIGSFIKCDVFLYLCSSFLFLPTYESFLFRRTCQGTIEHFGWCIL